ncbi:radical SAM protein [bacterium]|nr:radical SAM protein [bacterium]
MADGKLKKEWIKLRERLGFYSSRLISYPIVPPEHVYLSLTNRCNLQCKMCDIYKNPNGEENELSTVEIKDIIIQMKQMGIEHLILSGGEPLLRRDLLEIVELAIGKNIEMVDIITNGMLLNDDIIKKLINLRLNHITVSLDGLKSINDEIRGKGSFDKAERSIDRINYYKDKYDQKIPTVGINFTIMNSNIDDMIPMIEFARLKKCNIIVFQPLLFNNTKMYKKVNNPLWPSEEMVERLEKIIPEIINIKSESDNLNIYTDNEILKALPGYFKGRRPKSHIKCYEGIKRIVITSDGKLWSCSGVYGDLKEKSLKRIWYSFNAAKMRIKSKRCNEHCLQDCVYFPSGIIRDVKEFFKGICKAR